MHEISETAAWLGQTASLHPLFTGLPILGLIALWAARRRRAR